MVMKEAKFYRPSDPLEVVQRLAEYGERARILAGGTNLMANLNRRLLSPEALIYIGECGLSYIREDGDDLRIGATCSFSEIVHSPLVLKRAPLLASMVRRIGSPAIRNMATIGGNLARTSPAGDSAVALLALGARFRLVLSGGERVLQSDALLRDPGKTLLSPDELLEEVVIPSQRSNTHWADFKMGRRRGQCLSLLSGAISLEIEEGICGEARIALGAVSSVPSLALKAGELLEGKEPDAGLIAQVARVAAEEPDFVDDENATAWYRRRVCEVRVKRLLEQMLLEKE